MTESLREDRISPALRGYRTYILVILPLLFLIPMLTLSYIQFNEINKWLEFTGKERHGLRYIEELKGLLKDAMDLRGMTSAYLSGNSGYRKGIISQRKKIKDRMRSISELDKELGNLLETNGLYNQLHKKWREVEEKGLVRDPASSFELHNRFIEKILELTSLIGNTSNLIRDPERTSYYLMDYFVFERPVLAEIIGRTRGMGVRISVSGKLSEQEKNQLMALSSLAKTSLDSTVRRIDKILYVNPGINKELSGPIEEMKKRTGAFLRIVDRRLISADAISIKPGSYYDAASRAVDASLDLHGTVSKILDRTLLERMKKYRSQLFIFQAGFFMMVSLFLFVFVSLVRKMFMLERTDVDMKHRLEMEELVSNISGAMVKFSDTIIGINDSINDALKRIGTFAEADRSYIFRFSPSDIAMENTYEWCDEGIDPQINNLKGLFLRDYHWSISTLKNLETVHVADVDALPPEARQEKKSFKSRGIKSLVLVPMGSGEKVRGFLGLDSVRKKRSWSETEIDFLRLLGEIMTSALERWELNRKLEDMAERDYLTNACNRLKFDRLLLSEIKRAERYGRTFSIILFDIDFFKKVNDTFGHETGDDVLKEVTRIVSTHVRASDTFARWGGEEFVILVTETPLEGGRMIAEKLRREMEVHIFKDVGRLTCSFGVTEFRNRDDRDALIKRVDEALYESKNSGRNRVSVR